MKIIPRKQVLLVEIMQEKDPVKNGIILPRADTTNFDMVKVLAIGPEVEDIKVGDICYAHHGMTEEIEIGTKKGFISLHDVFATVDSEA